jgi:CRISPR-associated protein Cas7/Cse4/CasC subtype I-E
VKEHPQSECDLVVLAFVEKYAGATKLDKNKELITKVLLFLSLDEIGEMATALHGKWDIFLAEARAAQSAKVSESKQNTKRGKAAKVSTDEPVETADEVADTQANEAEEAESSKSELGTLVNQFKKKFSGRVSAADIALFGRMLAEGNAAKKIESACQVAHPISTHLAEPQDDFYTAMDDLKRADDVGGGAMIGNLDFATPCLYRYGRLDWEELKVNLVPRQDLVRGTAEAFLATFIKAIPSARKNSMSSPTMPSFVMAVVRSRGEGWSLANAFEEPIQPQGNSGVVMPSIKALDQQWQLVTSGFDEEPSTIKKVVYMVKTLKPVELQNIANQTDVDTKKVMSVESVNELIKIVMGELAGV